MTRVGLALRLASAALVAGAAAAASPELLAAGGNRQQPAAEASIQRTAAAPAPAFSGSLIGGGNVESSALDGHVVLMAFWSSSCMPCRQELSRLEATWRRSPGSFQLLGVDVQDGERAAGALIRREGVTFANISDPTGRIAAAYGVVGTPTVVAISPRGILSGRLLGPASSSQLERLVRDARA